MLLVGMLCLFALLIFRFPGTPSPTYGQTKIIGFAAYSLFPVILLFIAFRDAKDAERILDALLLVGAAWLGLSLAIAIAHGNLDLYRADPGALLGGSSQAGSGLGSRAVPVALVALASIIASNRRSPLRIGVGMVAIIVLLLSGHRGSIISFIVGLIVLLALTYRRLTFNRLVMGSIGVAILAATGWWTLQHAPQEILSRYQDPFESQSVTERLNLQRAALDGWLASPLFGSGTGASSFLATASDQTTFGVVNGIYPHNVTVELLAELGIVGAGLYLVTIGGTLVRALRVRRRRPVAPAWPLIAAAACTAAAFTASQMGADLTIQNDLWILSAILALSATAPTHAVERGVETVDLVAQGS